MIRWFLVLAAAMLAGCATVAAPPQPATFVVRHLHTPEGQRDPDLTVQGQAAAQQLASMLAKERIAAIFVTDFKRSRQTAAPLAARLGLTPVVYDPRDTAALIAQIRAAPSPALVVGHSNTVPDIVAQLGGPRPAPLSHPDFGDLWRIAPDGTTTKTRIP